MTMKPELIKAIHPADLLEQVTDALKEGLDMYTPLFVSHEGLLCQWVVPSACVYEYKLIVAMELDSLERQAVNLIELDYDFFMNAVLWNGSYLQWMSRFNNAGLTIREALTKSQVTEAVKVFENAKRDGELKLVVGVQPLGRLATASNGEHLGTIPYPVLVS